MLNSAETIVKVREHQKETLLAFSTGKDAICAWLAIRDHFDKVHPYFLYLVPGLEFVEESLAYYEKFFGVKITRLPHPSLYRMLNGLTFQPPERVAIIKQAKLPLFDYSDIRRVMVEDHALQKDILVADGVRAADSPMRNVSLQRSSSINMGPKKYHPIWDWKKADIIACLNKNRIKLPEDYKMFGRTFDGLDIRFLLPIKKQRPNDFKKLLEWFPLADLEIFRWEQANGKN